METSLPPPPGMPKPSNRVANHDQVLKESRDEPVRSQDIILPLASLTPTSSQPVENQSEIPRPKPTQPLRAHMFSERVMKETTLPPPPLQPFSKSRPTLPPLKLTSSVSAIQQRSKFSLTTMARTPTKNSRTAFLTAALSPSFVSAKPLHTRTHTTISEIVGNLAPERYLSLPPRSPPAAKALLATSVCKELRDVQKLESIRKRHGDVEGGGWFDYVLDSLGNGTKINEYAERIKNLVIPPWDGFVDRIAFLPLESLNIDSVMGQEFSTLVMKKQENLRLSKSRPVEPSEVRITRLKNAIQANIQRQAQAENKAIASVQTKVPPADASLMDDDLQPPLPSAKNALPASQPSKTTTPAASAPVNEIVMIDDDTPAQSTSEIPTPKPRVQLPVSLVFDDATGKVSIDWDIVEIPPAPPAPPAPPNSVSARPAQPVKTPSAKASASKKRTSILRRRVSVTPQPSNSSAHAQTNTKATPVATGVRPDPTLTHLETLLNRLDDDILPSSQPEKQPGSDPEVVLVDGAKDAPAPKQTQRRAKRKRSDRAQERAVETEQRASRMRSAVVSALQEHPEARRQRAARPSTANGHAKSKKKVTFSGRRMSRRSKKTVTPILDSSGSEKEYRRDEDDDFTIDAEDVVQVLPVPKANGARAPAPDLSPPTPRPPPPPLGREALTGLTEIESLDGSDMVSPQMRAFEGRGKQSSRKVSRSGSLKHARSHRSGGPSSRRERHRHADEDSHEGEPELWNREVLRVERLLEESEQDCDPLMNQIEYNPFRFYEQVPILRRVIKAAKAQHGNLMDMDKVDEYEEMDQFYKETRNDPPFRSGNGCPGTEFLESVFHQTERERLSAMRGYAGEPPNTALDALDDERLDVPGPVKLGGCIGNLTAEAGQPSSPSHGSSDSSADSSEEDEELHAAGSKRSRSQARSRASKARELQSRVCGDLLGTMTSEAKRRVLRWAERDFTWFDRGVDVMEIVASRAFKRCNRCDSGRGEEEKCEESILLKLWKDMSWRKVRRMRHRSSGAN